MGADDYVFQLYITDDALEPAAVAYVLRKIASQIVREQDVPVLFRSIYDADGQDVGRYAAKRRDYK